MRRWPHLIVGIVLVFPLLAFEGLWFLIFGYCGSYGDVGPIIALQVLTLPAVLPGLGALLDRRYRQRADAEPPSIILAIVTMVVIAALHLLVFYLLLLAADATSDVGSGEC